MYYSVQHYLSKQQAGKNHKAYQQQAGWLHGLCMNTSMQVNFKSLKRNESYLSSDGEDLPESYKY